MDWFIGFVAIISMIWAAALGYANHMDSKNKQRTFVYCPGCKRELVAGDNRIVTDDDLVRYYCGECYTVSCWDFDAPVPLLVISGRFNLQRVE